MWGPQTIPTTVIHIFPAECCRFSSLLVVLCLRNSHQFSQKSPSEFVFQICAGSFVYALNGGLYGLGSHVRDMPGGAFKVGDTLSLIYVPHTGTIRASKNGEVPQLIFSSIPRNWVPTVCISGPRVAWLVVEQ
jgi:hypothetical protein